VMLGHPGPRYTRPPKRLVIGGVLVGIIVARERRLPANSGH
jgi:hypothetical protein